MSSIKSTWAQRIILGLVAVFLLVYVVFQALRFFTGGYQTETAYFYTVSESAKVNGMVFRQEKLLEERVGTGVAAYAISDGTKVSTGTLIAEIYESAMDAENLYRARSLSVQKQQLEKAQDPGTASFSHTDALNRQIFSEISDIIEQVNSDEITDLQDTSDKLLLLMNTKQVATGKQENYREAIEQISAREQYYRGQVKGNTSEITAPMPGYFIRQPDGFENIYDLTKMDELMPGELSRLMMTSPVPATSRVGKMMTNHNWYYAVQVPLSEIANYRVGREVTLDFHISGLNPVPAYIAYINEDKDLQAAVVVFRSDYIDQTVVNLRLVQADVNFKSITGLRVSTSSLRFEGLQQGVYVIRGENMLFRPVDVVYEDMGFALCAITPASDQEYDTNLQQYDEVITEGTQLYDGKPIK